MTFAKKFAATIMLMSILAFALAVIAPSTAQGQARPAPPLPVTVVNTLADPVPVEVQGTARVAGTVNVRQSGDWNVVTALPGTPFAIELCSVNDDEDCSPVAGPRSVDLPLGQRFVVENVSLDISHANCHLLTVLAGVVTHTWLKRSDGHEYSTALTRIYADGGNSVTLHSLARDTPVGGSFCRVTLTGYLLPMP